MKWFAIIVLFFMAVDAEADINSIIETNKKQEQKIKELEEKGDVVAPVSSV